MDGRTREYLSGRFGDYYRSATLSLPPEAERREWGHIPFTGGEGTTMVRHQSLLDLGDVPDFLARTGPRHTYFSAAAYDDPGAASMSEKGWDGADLVFDLDADHLPGVDEAAADYAEMLAACKEALQNLLDLLRTDFGFEELEVVFSGGRGYHVHVRDPGLRDLDSEARREIVDYVRAIDVDADDLVRTVAVDGTTRRQLCTDGGWGARVHDRLVSSVAELREMNEPAALDRLQELDGIGDGRAETILGAVTRNPEAVRAGNVEVGGPGLRRLLDALATETFRAETAPIDEPVTTDLRRLIRLPGSIHGGSGLVVRPIEPEAVADFEPLVDAVPERFRGRRIMVNVTEPGPVPVGADSFTVGEGLESVPEFAGVFLMARGRAEKAPE
ncbi:MAG: DNA primase small subunit PriS [Halolamina sp.]